MAVKAIICTSVSMIFKELRLRSVPSSLKLTLQGRNTQQGLETILELIYASIQNAWSGSMVAYQSTFTVKCGFLQGSVLSPVLFLLIMDPLLQGLEANHLGTSLCSTHLGAFAHADDIHAFTSSLTTLK